MIPKIIHYCWFGGTPKPESVLKCINSWKKYCPDYEIREWTEADFDVSQNLYCQQAYEAKAWGFVPDYIRLWIIYNYGGIYLDTDVQILRNFDPLLKHQAFVGFEKDTNSYVNLGQGFGAEAGNRFIADNMHIYDNLTFLKDDGEYNRVPSPVYTTDVLIQYGLDRERDATQQLDSVTVFPSDYFCPKSFNSGIVEKTRNTFSIHHFDSSWFSEEQQQRKNKRWKDYQLQGAQYWIRLPLRLAKQILGMEIYLKIRNTIRGEQ